MIHCAAHIWVGELVREPARYYANNTANAIGLFDLCATARGAAVVFSSTAAVYGQPDVALIDETQPLAPINPYGASKMMGERVLADIAAATGCATPSCATSTSPAPTPTARIGEATPDNAHLIKLACETALGLRPAMAIHGTDYPTPGRHLHPRLRPCRRPGPRPSAGARTIWRGGASLVANCGYGHGFSVAQVLDTARRVTGVDFPIDEGRAGPGDPAVLVADSRRLQSAARLDAAARRSRLHRGDRLALGAASAGPARWRARRLNPAVARDCRGGGCHVKPAQSRVHACRAGRAPRLSALPRSVLAAALAWFLLSRPGVGAGPGRAGGPRKGGSARAAGGRAPNYNASGPGQCAIEGSSGRSAVVDRHIGKRPGPGRAAGEAEGAG